MANLLPNIGAPGPDALYPLVVWFCHKCLLVQLEEFQSPDEIFADYPYLSSYSSTWLDHTRAYATEVIDRLSLCSENFVVELASNDGHLLRNFVASGCRVMGVEPAANVAEIAKEHGVPTRTEFFGALTAAKLRVDEGGADLVVANNVLAHVPDLHDFIEGIRLLLAPAGTVTIEFPHLLSLIAHCQFDTIYHEHFSYFSLYSARAVLAAHGLRVYHVQHLPTHGGSLRLWLCHEQAALSSTGTVEAVLAEERAAGMQEARSYHGFGTRVAAVREQLRAALDGVLSNGRTIAGYGAPAKACTLLNYCGVGPDILPFTVDANPLKQGRMIPGVRVPIYTPTRLEEEPVDVVFVLAWNLRAEISRLLEQHRKRPHLLFYQPAVELV